MKRVLLSLVALSVAACSWHAVPDTHLTAAEIAESNTPQAQSKIPASQMSSHGLAGWIGQEFAGRTTANGEIFDPMLMTASHRTLPFGTLLDVHNAKTGQTVRVRVNDRGPYVGDRLIDLSYAAAQQIGIAESGGGEIDMTVVKIGRGDREPPASFNVTVPDTSAVAATPTPAPAPAPAPAPTIAEPQPSAPATVESVQVTEEHASGVETRRQVAANGTTIEDVPVKTSPLPASPAPTPRATPPPAPRVTPQPQPRAAAPRSGRYVVQVGAFSQEANAKALQKKLANIGQDATIDHTSLYLVRIGPFETRDQAATVRAKLEAAGISAIITTAQ
ncbi:MAG TPA: septal ring lytic transglycosylase RlpA family protein [Thermoanaerobaculia bacterium]|jgi:rare lipoprotein A|nr:septal ring lytic transglycosylase RlpA family protein [Thermoanaerobaculia bacterium]